MDTEEPEKYDASLNNASIARECSNAV